MKLIYGKGETIRNFGTPYALISIEEGEKGFISELFILFVTGQEIIIEKADMLEYPYDSRELILKEVGEKELIRAAGEICSKIYLEHLKEKVKQENIKQPLLRIENISMLYSMIREYPEELISISANTCNPYLKRLIRKITNYRECGF